MTPNNTRGRITGVGGIFFKSPDHKALRDWYQSKLGVPDDPASGMLGGVVWSIFPSSTEYLNPSQASFMVNYIVDDLDAFLVKCAAHGVSIDPKREDHEYGRFAWIFDPDGNKIELWEPR